MNERNRLNLNVSYNINRIYVGPVLEFKYHINVIDLSTMQNQVMNK